MLRDKTWGLFPATFSCSLAGGILLTCLPFIFTALGGADKEVGFGFGLNFAAYLTGCLLGGIVMDRFSVKRTLLVSTVMIIVSTVGIYVVISLNGRGVFPIDPILALFGLLMLNGSATAFFWPPMMGWISRDHEGARLTRRLGFFNVCWATAISIGPWVGGHLVEINLALPLIIMTGLFMIGFCFLSIVRCPDKNKVSPDTENDKEVSAHLTDGNILKFKWISRVALVTAFVATSLLRTQFALFFTEDLGFSKFQYGKVLTVLSLMMGVLFFVAGKTHRWHQKLLPFIGSQVLIMAGLVFILNSTGLGGIYPAVMMIGIGAGFVYCSHQYYGVSGGKKRSGLMAIHEILLSAGFIIGSIMGGFLGEYFNRYIPYQFGISCIGVSLVVQLAIWFMPMREKT